MSNLLRSHLLRAAHVSRGTSLRTTLTLRNPKFYSTGTGKESPLNVDNQSKTGVQPSYGPIGVTAALKNSHDDPSPTLFTHEFSLADRVALVSGGNRGLGLEMALALIEAGARAVYCVDLAKEPSEEWSAVQQYAKKLASSGKTGGEGRLEYISGNVTNQEEIWKIGKTIGDREGRMDACVAAAGILKEHTDCLTYPAAQFRQVMDVNVNGVLFTAQAAGQQMDRFGNGGSIVLIASMSGSITNKMARSMACELGPRRIRVNSLSPGHIYTNMTAAYLDTQPHLLEKWASLNPMGRIGRPDELRGVVTWLASDASTFCTVSLSAEVIIRGSEPWGVAFILTSVHHRSTLESGDPGWARVYCGLAWRMHGTCVSTFLPVFATLRITVATYRGDVLVMLVLKSSIWSGSDILVAETFLARLNDCTARQGYGENVTHRPACVAAKHLAYVPLHVILSDVLVSQMIASGSGEVISLPPIRVVLPMLAILSIGHQVVARRPHGESTFGEECSHSMMSAAGSVTPIHAQGNWSSRYCAEARSVVESRLGVSEIPLCAADFGSACHVWSRTVPELRHCVKPDFWQNPRPQQGFCNAAKSYTEARLQACVISMRDAKLYYLQRILAQGVGTFGARNKFTKVTVTKCDGRHWHIRWHYPTMPEVLLPERKGKEREAPQSIDLAAKFVALQRKQAHLTRPKERSDRPQPSKTQPHPQSPRRMHAPPIAHPNIIVSQASPQADGAPDEQDFERRLKISHASPRHVHKRAEHTSPRGAGRLYNPNTDNIRRPTMTAEPDGMSEDDSASVARSGVHPRLHSRAQPARDGARLFDPRKDNPYQPGLLVRGPNANGSPPNSRPTPTPKSSGDWVSASSTSSASYAQSTISSTFTLNSTTTDSSMSSAIFSNGPRSEESTASASVLSSKLKHLYRRIVSIEDQLNKESESDTQDGIESSPQRVLLKTQQNGVIKREAAAVGDEGERDRYKGLVRKHKELSEVIHDLLTLTTAPSVPASLRHIPKKYTLVGRLWKNAFYHLLEMLRRAASSCSPDAEENVALEHLVSFIYYAYAFYTGLLDEPNLAEFSGNWVESLGDLARYRSAVAQLLESRAAKEVQGNLTMNAVTRASLTANALLSATGPATPEVSALSDKNVSPTPAVSPAPVARNDDSPPASDVQQPAIMPGMAPSVGIIAARNMELIPEKEQWRLISREWFTKGLAFAPTSGKLHHYLGMLSRDAEPCEKEELRAVYHFVKSMIATHPFTTSRETVLQMWSSTAQARRQAPDAGLTDLFLLLQGMIFTNIQLDDFKSVLARFEEKLLLEGRDVQERDWIMMAVINIGSILEYGRSTAVLRRVAGIQPESGAGLSPLISNGNHVKLMKKSESDEKKMDVDDEDNVNGDNRSHRLTSPSIAEATPASSSASEELPVPLAYALQLTFMMLSHTLRNPIRPPQGLSRSSLNPYITVLMTFLTTVLKDKTAERVLARAIPWEELATFLTRIPRKVIHRESIKEAELLSSGGCNPLPEDWCLRGLAWSGKKIYERGFWNRDTKGEEKNFETDILDRKETDDALAVGIIEDEVEEEGKDGDKQAKGGKPSIMVERWVRIARSAVKIGKTANGLVFIPPTVRDGHGEWRVEGALADKVARWREEDRCMRAEEERRLRGTRWVDDDGMDVDEDDNIGDADEMSEDDEGATEEVQALKVGTAHCSHRISLTPGLQDRLKYLKGLLTSSKRPGPRQRSRGFSSRENTAKPLRIIPGFTILVVDTNILLSSLSMIATLVESLQWTVVIPLPVIMELDGLASDASVLGEAAGAATSYIVSHLRSHSTSLKIQTSKGNYLANLNVRTEAVDLHDNQSWERNMDDLILRAAMWQSTHWVDRSVFLQTNGIEQDTAGASKVVLLTFDRMLRVKARSREVDAATEQDLAAILARKS
ncbi:hypothetical protein BDW22DRAFT_1346852 [Trametopsis cervina]|nr:hypothetical protein BDW22DRAFT_1346852 [Trametopsis cervina]